MKESYKYAEDVYQKGMNYRDLLSYPIRSILNTMASFKIHKTKYEVMTWAANQQANELLSSCDALIERIGWDTCIMREQLKANREIVQKSEIRFENYLKLTRNSFSNEIRLGNFNEEE